MPSHDSPPVTTTRTIPAIHTNPDGSPMDTTTFLRVVHWLGHKAKRIEIWNGAYWVPASLVDRWTWTNTPEMIDECERAITKAGKVLKWGKFVVRDPETNEIVPDTTAPRKIEATQHVPAGERIGQIAIENINGGLRFEVLLWNGESWVVVGPKSYASHDQAEAFARLLTNGAPASPERTWESPCPHHVFHTTPNCIQCATGKIPSFLKNEDLETIVDTLDGAFWIWRDGKIGKYNIFTAKRNQLGDGVVWYALTYGFPGSETLGQQFETVASAETALLAYGRDRNIAVSLIMDGGTSMSTVFPNAYPQPITFPRAEPAGDDTVTIDGTPEQVTETGRAIVRELINEIGETIGVKPEEEPEPGISGAPCRKLQTAIPGQWDVFTWTGTGWKQIAGKVSERTADGIIAARMNDPEIRPSISTPAPAPAEPTMKSGMIKQWRTLMREVRKKLENIESTSSDDVARQLAREALDLYREGESGTL